MALIIGASILTLASVWHDAPIVDEVPHIGAGYSYIADQTYQFNPEHPPLAKDLAGLALKTLPIPSDFLATYNAAHPGVVNDQWNFGRQLIYHSGVDPIAIVHAAKLPLILFFILSGILIFAWTKRTYNPRAAFIAVFLFTLSPTIIAHSRFVATDVAALFGILFSSYFFYKYLDHQSKKNFVWAGLAFGVALLTKFSTFLLVPYIIILAFLWAWSHRYSFGATIRLLIKSVLILAFGFILVVGPVYQYHILNYPPEKQKSDSANQLKSFPGILAETVAWGSDKPVLRPYAQYGLGLIMATQRASGGNRTFFLGQVSGQSFKTYFPIVFGLKEPIPLLVLILLALWTGLTTWRAYRGTLKEKVSHHFSAVTMVLWVLLYAATSISSNLNIGIRHLLPIYGFIFVLTAGQIEYVLHSHKKWIRFAVYGLFVWYLLECLMIFPYYLTYFNEFAGGPSGGHRYVVDSNLDWGQDLWRLGDYVKQHQIQKIYVDYFGWAEQEFYLGQPFVWLQGGTYTSAESFFASNPNGGWLALSATYFAESTLNPSGSYYWLTNYKPEAVIGNSIFVYHITRQ